MKKKIIAVLCAAVCAAGIFTSCGKPEDGEETSKSSGYTQITTQQNGETSAPESTEPKTTESTSERTETKTTADTSESTTKPKEPQYAFKSALVGNITTGEEYFKYNSQKKVSPASLTKMLTALVALEYADSQEVYTVGPEQTLVHEKSSICLIKKGHKLTLEQLLYGMLMASGNDAAYTVAVNVAKSSSGKELSDRDAVAVFVRYMNEYCRMIGMNNSNFINPDGWDDPKQYTTAEDMLVLARAVLSQPLLKKIVGTQSKHVVFKSGENITWQNSNKLLNQKSEYYNKHCKGIKTGTTNSAGCCLVSAFEKGGNTYIVTVFDCPSDKSRYENANMLFKKYCK